MVSEARGRRIVQGEREAWLIGFKDGKQDSEAHRIIFRSEVLKAQYERGYQDGLALADYERILALQAGTLTVHQNQPPTAP